MKEKDRTGIYTEIDPLSEHKEVVMLADIIHACSEVMQGMMKGEDTDVWCEDTDVFIIRDPERPEKNLRVYFNALDETMLDEDNKAEKRGVFQAAVDLVGQVSELKQEERLEEIARVCSIWICKNQNAPNEFDGTISLCRREGIPLTKFSEVSTEGNDHILVYVIRLWNFAPDAVCHSEKDELLVTLHQLYDVLI